MDSLGKLWTSYLNISNNSIKENFYYISGQTPSSDYICTPISHLFKALYPDYNYTRSIISIVQTKSFKFNPCGSNE